VRYGGKRRARLAIGLLTALGGPILFTSGLASTALAQQEGSIKIPGNFVFVQTPSPDRCLWGVGVEFPAIHGAVSYTIDYWDGYWGHDETGGLSVPVTGQPGDMPKGVNYFGITGGGGPLPCVADPEQGGRFDKPPTVWANFPGKAPHESGIAGYVTDKDGDPVQGATVSAYGPTHATAVTGPGGLYYIQVDAGHYRVVPDDSAVKKSSFAPTYADVDAPRQGQAMADFKLDSGLQVTVDLSATTTAAGGLSVVQGTLNTTKNGKPDPGVTVQLSVDPTDPGTALTTAPKVAVCGAGGRIWPSGQVTDLEGKAVNVVTDANGQYKFSLTIGTVPGSWQLDAWAENEDGSLSTDVSNASDTKTVSVEPVAPKTLLSEFLTELDALKSTPYSSQIQATNPGAMATLLGNLAAKGPTSGVRFSGLSFSVGSGTDGQVLVIAPAGSQFRVGANGDLLRSSSLMNDLVIDPQEWTGKGLPASISNGSSLQYVVQNGLLHDIPNVAQWEAGAGALPGWTLKPNKLSDPSASLQYFGWAYFPPGPWPTGYCN
jgi:Carboxypeptidase regulatory-like domain